MSAFEHRQLFAQSNIIIKESMLPKRKATMGFRDSFSSDPSHDRGIEDIVDMYEMRQCQGKLYLYLFSLNLTNITLYRPKVPNGSSPDIHCFFAGFC